MKIYIALFSVLFLSKSLLAECLVDYSVMYVLAKNERHTSKDIGYPYLISFNNQKDALKAKNTLELNWLDSRTVDCKSLENCQVKLSNINSMQITNLDLGGYQINQSSFSFSDKTEYFNLKKSYENACNIVYAHYLETNEWSWKTIARYHSKTPKLNKPYAMNLEKKYANLIQTQIEGK